MAACPCVRTVRVLTSQWIATIRLSSLQPIQPGDCQNPAIARTLPLSTPRGGGPVMGQPVSDAAVEILGVCRHSLRSSFGAPPDYPYTAARPADDNPPPALFRRVQVSSPPPPRD